MGKLYTCAEVAEYFRIELWTVRDWIKKKKLPAIKIGRDYRISEEDLREFENSARTTNK